MHFKIYKEVFHIHVMVMFTQLNIAYIIISSREMELQPSIGLFYVHKSTKNVTYFKKIIDITARPSQYNCALSFLV